MRTIIDVKQTAAKMLGIPEADLPPELVRRLKSVEELLAKVGGRITSKQIVALIVQNYLLTHVIFRTGEE